MSPCATLWLQGLLMLCHPIDSTYYVFSGGVGAQHSGSHMPVTPVLRSSQHLADQRAFQYAASTQQLPDVLYCTI